MSTQIAVRLSDELVRALDSIVREGPDPSRASVIERASEREIRRLSYEQEAENLLVDLDKARPAVLLTRDLIAPPLNHVTVAPITTAIRGIGSEVTVGRANGLDPRAWWRATTSQRSPGAASSSRSAHCFPARSSTWPAP